MKSKESAIYAGTRTNIAFISSMNCGETGSGNTCSYATLLGPLSVVDFVPSLALDTLLLPVTMVHATTLPSPREPIRRAP